MYQSSSNPQYAAVPQSPRAAMSRRKQPAYYPQQQPTQPVVHHNHQPQQLGQHSRQQQRPTYQPPQQYVPGGRGAIARSVATGSIGMAYGPYSYHAPTPSLRPTNGPQQTQSPRLSTIAPSETTHASTEKAPPPAPPQRQPTTTVPQQLLWEKDSDFDEGHLDRSFALFSGRGIVNMGMLFIILAGLLTLFIGYPVILHVRKQIPKKSGFNLGGINGTGQIPELPGLPGIIDKDTPEDAYTRTGTDGKKYNLVFSDEFNIDGRSFYPGDDPFWEAVDLHYWPTGDLEWYDPSAITTANGKLVITITQQRQHDLNFMSGMLTTWNKFCFTTGYIEVSVSLPGRVEAPGLWPGVWTLGNLGRAGYGATTEGMWPYSYDSCDVGTFVNQTDKDGNPSAAASNGLSSLPGQRLSACTCPGSDHPGPTTSTGRGVPEIDILEAEIDVTRWQGRVSQSFQVAPYNAEYQFDESAGATTIYNTDKTHINTYKGGPFQQAVSAVTDVDKSLYNDQGYGTYAYEWWSDPKRRGDGYITWFSEGQRSWTITSASVGPDPVTQIQQRLISEEPMYIIMNLGMAHNFQAQDYKHLEFPSRMYVDYVRVYQRAGVKDGVTCDPPQRPTSEYINKHMAAYSNPNVTTWAQAGNTFPRNRLWDGC